MRVFLSIAIAVSLTSFACAQNGSVYKSPTLSDADIATKWETEKAKGSLRGDFNDQSIVSLRGEILRQRAELQRIEAERQQILKAIADSDATWLGRWLTAVSDELRRQNPRRPKQTVKVEFQ